jgi:acetyl-CoA carboxylase biotin carboxyl carrier protein
LKIRELKELLTLISERNITEFELEEEGVRIKIRTVSSAPAPAPAAAAESSVASHPAPAATQAQVLVQPAGAGTAVSTSGAASGEAQPEVAEDGLIYVTAPMVGTFYRQPEPGAPPFVKEGDTVSTGQVLCIIEAMKLMNEIECEHQGELVKAFIDNGQPVQYGDRLFAIRAT